MYLLRYPYQAYFTVGTEMRLSGQTLHSPLLLRFLAATVVTSTASRSARASAGSPLHSVSRMAPAATHGGTVSVDGGV